MPRRAPRALVTFGSRFCLMPAGPGGRAESPRSASRRSSRDAHTATQTGRTDGTDGRDCALRSLRGRDDANDRAPPPVGVGAQPRLWVTALGEGRDLPGPAGLDHGAFLGGWGEKRT